MDKHIGEEVGNLDQMIEDDDLKISPEEMMVVDFINELQLQYETEAQVKIAEKTKEKFGDLGKKVLEQLNDNFGSTEGVQEECTECGKVSEEWLKESQEKLNNVEIFLDTELDEIANDLIQGTSGVSITNADIAKALYEHKYVTDDLDDTIKSLKKKILFKGIVQGWLLAEYFKG